MISFIDKQLDKENFKVWLYSPGSDFLGELIVDKPVLNLELEGLVSSFSFTIPENIDIVDQNKLNTIVNPRLNETLDQFQVEVWYGDLTTDNYQKQRFIIIDKPAAFGNDITEFSYRAYSREYETKFIRMVDWPGILIREFLDVKSLNAAAANDSENTFSLARTPKDNRLIRAELVKDFVYRLVEKTVSEVPYQFSIQPRLDTIKIYKQNENETWSLLTKDTDYIIDEDPYTGVYSIVYQTAGNANLNINDQVYVEYRLENPLTFGLIRSDIPSLTSEYDFYYNPDTNQIKLFVPSIPKVFARSSVLSYDEVIPADSRVIVKVYYESTASINPSTDPFFDNLTTDSLTIQQVLNNILVYGDEDNSEGKWSARYADSLPNDIRSGFKFGNTTLFSAINETLKAFDAIAVPDTINKIFYIYNKTTPDTFIEGQKVVSSYRQATGLSIEYGKYLQNIQQSISTEDVVTIMRGIGADNITADSATPTGYNEWEDYTYYLDGVFITNWEQIVANPNTGLSPILSASGRWMSDQLTTKLLMWQFARASIEGILYNELPANFVDRFGDYITEGGIITVQDRIAELIVENQQKLIPLRVEQARNNGLLTTLEILENVEHLFNWNGTFEGVSYSGIEGYEDYVNAKNTKINSELNSINDSLSDLQEDFDFINDFLQTVYLSIRKNNFVALFNNEDLDSYNFTTEDFEELAGFRREGVYENKFIVKASDLFKAMKQEIDAVKQPRVEVSANIIGLLQALEARSEWNNLVLGGLANIIVPRLNVDIQIQIKSLTISPESNSTNIKFSTEKNYIGTGQKYLGRFFSNAAYNLKNNLGYNEGLWTQGSIDGLNSAEQLANGFLISGDNPLTTQTIVVDDNGITTNGHTVNPIDDTIVSSTSDIGRMLLFGFVKINAGRIDVFNRNQAGQIVNKVVIAPTGLTQETSRSIVKMDKDGFAIFGKVDGELDKQFFVDEFGNIQFAGQLQPIVKEGLFEDFNITPVNIQTDSFVFKYEDPIGNPVPATILLTAELRVDYEVSDWQYDAGNNDWQSLNANGTTFTVNPDASIWTNKDAIRFRVIAENIDESAVTDFDIITISKLFNGNDGEDGENGLDAFTVNLTNEAHSLPRTAAGTVTYTGSGTDIEVYEGTTKLDFDNTNSGDGKWNVSAVGVNITPGVASPLGSVPRSARISQHSNMTATPASVTYTISGKRINGENFSITKIQSLSFAQDGQSITGPEGKKAVTGIVYFQLTSSTTPSTPSASWYNIGTNLFQNLTANWSLSSPTFQAGNQNKYWFSRFSGVEGTTTNIVSPVSFTTPQQAINFSGLVTFTNPNEPLSLENTNVTSIEGGLLKTAVIDSQETIPSSNPIAPQMRIDLNNRKIHIGQPSLSPGYDQTGIFLGYDNSTAKFSIKGSGTDPNFLRWTGSALEMRGRITATSGTIGEFNIITTTSGDDKAGFLFAGNPLSDRILLTDSLINIKTAFNTTSIRPLTSSFGFSTDQLNFPWEGISITGGDTNSISTLGNINIRATGSSNSAIFVQGNGSALIQLRSAGSLGTLVSSTIVKKDIENLQKEDLQQFIDTIEIKQFKYKEDDSVGISLIIEEEENKNIPFKDFLFLRDTHHIRYETWDEVPQWLKVYENTEALTKEIDGYYFNPKAYKTDMLSAITVAVVKEQDSKIKNLEERLAALEAQLNNET